MNRLKNYLHTQRRRAGLTQQELATLVGVHRHTTISKQERGLALPSLQSALAYEVLFRTPVREIFTDEFQNIEEDVFNNVTILLAKLECDMARVHTCTFLRAVLPELS